MQLSLVEKDNINTFDIEVYTEYLKPLKEDINVTKILKIKIIKPFERDTGDIDFWLQQELIELKKNLEL